MKATGRYANYSVIGFRRDVVSGVVVGIIAIPLGMAFAIAAGVDPRYGLYTTIVAGFLISLLGGSRFQIGGPTGAFVPVLLAVVLQYGYENLLIAGFLAGVLLLLMGVLRFGALIRFIPRPVTIGFTTGIAVIIFFGQIPNLLGMREIVKHEHFLPNLKEIVVHIGTVNVYSVITGAVGLAAMLGASRLWPKLPASLIGLTVSSLTAALFFNGQVATIGSAYGGIPSALPHIGVPKVSADQALQLLKPALIIAVLGGIESLLSAVVADRMSGQRHNSNRELIGQGIANMVAPLFGGIPATGAIARTAANIRSGAASPVSGMLHGVVVLLVLVVFAPLASGIPLSAMAPILMLVAWNMSDRKEFSTVLKTRTGDTVVLLLTFMLTVFADLTTAVAAGLLSAALLFMAKAAGSLTVDKVLPDHAKRGQKVASSAVTDRHDCPQIHIFSVEGSLFFGAASRFEQAVKEAVRRGPKVLLLRMGKVLLMDTSAEAYLTDIVRDVKANGGNVLVTGIRPDPRKLMERTGLAEEIGDGHFFEHTGQAIAHAITRLDKRACVGCRHFAFHECTVLSKSK